MGGWRFIPGYAYKPEGWQMFPSAHESYDEPSSPPLKHAMHAFAGINVDSGGPEVLELLADIRPCPQSLKSSCRIDLLPNYCLGS